MSFELLGTKTLVCMDINKWKNAFSEKFGLFYLPGSAPENLTGPLKSGFSSCSDYPVDGTLKLCHETLIAHEKESIWSDRSVPRKRPKRAKLSVIFNNCLIKQKYGYFGTANSDLSIPLLSLSFLPTLLRMTYEGRDGEGENF